VVQIGKEIERLFMVENFSKIFSMSKKKQAAVGTEGQVHYNLATQMAHD
jgi:hypothetical protein